jgi:outer membrane protein assembly factor BamB
VNNTRHPALTRSVSVPNALVAILAFSMFDVPLMKLYAQGPSPIAAGAMPGSWLQLRSGTDNSGVIPGTLDVSWSFKSPRPVRALSVASGVVLVGTESADADAPADAFAPDQQGFLIALDAQTGIPRWSRTVPSWVHGDPAIYRGVAIVTFGRWPMTQPGGAMAINVNSGRELWSLRTDGGIMPAPAVDSLSGSVMVVGDGILFSLALNDGTVRYQAGLKSPDAMSSIRIDESQRVYVGSIGTVSSYAAPNGRLLWEYRSPRFRGVLDVPVAVAKKLVFTTGVQSAGLWNAARSLPVRNFIELLWEAHGSQRVSEFRNWIQEQWLIALDRNDGHVVWKRRLGLGLDVPRNTSGTPVVSGNTVVVSSPVSKKIWAYEVNTGQVLWSRSLRATHKGAVTVFADDVIFGDKDGELTVLRLQDGMLIGNCVAGAAFTPFAPLIVGRTAFIATRNGWVHALAYQQLRLRAIRRDHESCF